MTSDPVDPTKPIPTVDEMISTAKAEAEAALKAEEEADKDAALALSEAALAKSPEIETDGITGAQEGTVASDVTPPVSDSSLDPISEEGHQDTDASPPTLTNLSKATGSSFTLTPDTASSSASFIPRGSGSSSTASLLPSYEKKKGRAKSVFSFASSASTIRKARKDKSKTNLPEVEPYAPPTMPVPDTLEYAHLPIHGECVPLPHEALAADRRRLPLFRQPHTVGKTSHLARPIIANRIYSF